MTSTNTYLDWRRSLGVACILATAILAWCYLVAPRASSAAEPAQVGTVRLEISKRLQGTNVVQFGQELTFTIRITNTGSISVTTLPLIDEYESSVLELVRSEPVWSTNIVTPATAAGLITWSDLTTDTLFGPLDPGQAIDITTVFRVIAPRAATVNRARIGAAVGYAGGQDAGDGQRDAGDAIGGQVIVTKELAPGVVAASGLPLTFTITIQNDGAADLTRVPLRDTFDPTILRFVDAEPLPGAGSDPATGILVWDDVLPVLGLSRMAPGDIVTVTTVFIALRPVDTTTINRADTIGVRDEFGDEVISPRQAEVPIRIVPGPAEITPTATLTPFPTERPRQQRTATPVAPTATMTATTMITATATLTQTATLTSTPGMTLTEAATGTTTIDITPTAVVPSALPSTGGSADVGWLLALAALALGGALGFAAHAANSGRR